MNMKKILRIALIAPLIIGAIWAALTLWAESPGAKKSWNLGNPSSGTKVLIIYNPDIFYNLDEQICKSFGKALTQYKTEVTVATTSKAAELGDNSYDLYVFCANTYNWRPDWQVSRFIRNTNLKGKPAVALTLGSGSTEASQKALEKIITETQAKLIFSRSIWLMRPNDESKDKESNIDVAVEMAYQWGKEVGEKL
jgi:hypothetical protein